MVVIMLQYTLANPNRGVPIQKIYVPITEFVRISEVALIIWRTNNTEICGNPLFLVQSFNTLLINYCRRVTIVTNIQNNLFHTEN